MQSIRQSNPVGFFNWEGSDPASWSYSTADGMAGLQGMDAGVELNGVYRSVFGSSNALSSTVSKKKDVYGSCTVLTIEGQLTDVKVQTELQVTLYPELSFITLSMRLRNLGDQPVVLGKCSLVRSGLAGSLELGGALADTRVFVQSAWVIDNAVRSLGFEGGLHRSKTVSLLYQPNAKAAFNCSFLTFDRANTEIHYTHDADADSIGVDATCDFEGYELAPDGWQASETAYVELVKDPFASLEQWADRVSQHYQPKFAERPSLGWVGGWTWRDGFSQETYEQLVLENTAAIQRKLGGFGIRNIWTSIGNLGDMLPGNWLEENREAFPHGWSWLVDKLAGYGQRLGFWVAPFWIPNKLSNLFEEHKDNLLKQNGEYVFFNYRSPYGKSGTLPKEERVGFYSLDASHPKTLQFLRHVFEEYNRIGIRFFMIDFLFAGSGSTPGHFPYNGYYDRTRIKGPEVYREALKVIREASGEDTYLLSSTGTTFQNVGCVDAVRVGPDIGEGRPLIETMAEYPATYTIHGWQLIRTVAASMATTYFTDRKLYYNDGFNVLTVDKPIPLEEARATVSMFGLSSGPVMLGDDIATISAERLALVKKCLPPYTRMARPVDLFTAVAPETPKVFNLRVEKDWDSWNVVGVLNAGASALSVDLLLGDLGLEAEQAYCVFDFWNEMYLGEASASLHVEVPAYSVRVLRISRARLHPWLLSTDMHVTQGGVEIPRLRWDERRMSLQGVCTRPAGETGTLYFRLPPGWKPVRYEGLHTAKLRADNLVIVSKALEFPVETVSWRIDFERYGEHATGNYAGLEVKE